MTRRAQKHLAKPKGPSGPPSKIRDSTDGHRGAPWNRYESARKLAVGGHLDQAAAKYRKLAGLQVPAALKALIFNDLAVLSAARGDETAARNGFAQAITSDRCCALARQNLALLGADEPSGHGLAFRQSRAEALQVPSHAEERPSVNPAEAQGKVAILSFLFNWPSTGGGIIHTVELASFLRKAGYDARHIFARYAPWRIGSCEQHLETPHEILHFEKPSWNIAEIQQRYRRAVENFDPDWVIITDCWNFKPLLAQAVRDYSYFLRQQALECLCPLNNLRLLVDQDGQARQCPLHQLATPQECLSCLIKHAAQSGSLHQWERELAGVGTAEYEACLRTALREAEAVLVLNPLIESLLAPYCQRVRVATWGMDPARFPWPWPAEPERLSDKTTLFMAGVIPEMIKGFHVLHAACRKLWQKRQDFELVATGEPAGSVDEFTHFVGWQPQEGLPRYLRAADIVVMPTIAQEGLGRTTVEAMAVGRPVIASCIGGLPYTVQDGATGLLCEPGNADDLAEKIERLLDDAPLRERMGLLGRERFEREFTWETVIERDYRPLLKTRTQLAAAK